MTNRDKTHRGRSYVVISKNLYKGIAHTSSIAKERRENNLGKQRNCLENETMRRLVGENL